MGIKVHVVDATIWSNSRDFVRKASQAPGDIRVSIGAACNGIDQVVTDIVSKTVAGSIDAIIFYGHGASGVQGVSIGKDGRYATSELAALTSRTLDDPAFQSGLLRLRGRFSPGGFIVLHGCHTGGGDAGRELIKKLSRLAGVPVKAATTYQIVGRSELVGRVMTARPDGSINEDLYEGARNFAALPVAEETVLFGAEIGHALGFW